MMPTYIIGYRWLVFTLQRSDEWRPKFESWSGTEDGRVTIRMFGKEFVYGAEWSKYPPATQLRLRDTIGCHTRNSEIRE